MDHLHTWIQGLQVHPSHYSRGNQVTRQYLDQKYSTISLHQHYSEDCIRDKIEPVHEETFRKTFTHSYNIVKM